MKIGVIFTGGTIGSQKGENGIAPSKKAPLRLLRDYAARTGDAYCFETAGPDAILSENLTFAHICSVAAHVRAKMDEWDGIIVTHGTDTLQYTGAALGYIFGLSSKPVVLVSANYPLDDARSNGLDNFCAAVAFLRAVPEAKGVFTAYRNRGESVRIHRSTRILAHHALDDVVFSLHGTIATVEGECVTLTQGYTELADEQSPMSEASLSTVEGRILRLIAYPGMRYPTLEGVTAVLLETYHSGTVATASPALRRFAERAKEAGVPILLAGVPTGGTAYASGSAYGALGFSSLPPIAPISAYMKLCLTLSDGREPAQALSLPLGGDLSF